MRRWRSAPRSWRGATTVSGAPKQAPSPMQLPELFAHAGRAAFWAALAKWFDLVGGGLTFLCMVRLLRPDDFGVYGLALLVILAPETIVAGALSESLIQRAEL